MSSLILGMCKFKHIPRDKRRDSGWGMTFWILGICKFKHIPRDKRRDSGWGMTFWILGICKFKHIPSRQATAVRDAVLRSLFENTYITFKHMPL